MKSKSNKLFNIILAFLLASTGLLPMGDVYAEETFIQKEINPDTTDWFVYEYPDPNLVAGTPLDASWVLDSPAGKHGYLSKTVGNKLVFEDNTSISFFGTNFENKCCFANYEDSVIYAKQLAQAGINIVRMFIDDGSYIGLWGRKAKISRVFEDGAMDRLCFLISELKKRGIYVTLNMVTSKPYFEDDTYLDIENLSNPYFYFGEDLIEYQKQFISMICNYYNPYTGLCLKDEPAIASIQFRNENSIATANDEKLKSEIYNAKLKKMFNEWLVGKYATRGALENAWAKRKGENYTNISLKDFEDPQLGTVQIPGYSTRESSLYTEKRRIDTNKFLDELQQNYFSILSTYAKELGVKCLISGSTSWDSNGIERLNFHSNIFTDYTDTHNYQSNSSGTAYKQGVTRSDAPTSVLNSTYLGLVGQMVARNVFGMPHVISEWNDLSPNMYRSESLLLVTAYSSLHGMQPLGFAWYGCGTNSSTENIVKSPFKFNNPETWGALPAAAIMFHRGDVKETEKGYYYRRLKGNESFSPAFQYLHDGLKAQKIGLIGKSGMIFDDKCYDENYNSNDVLYLEKQAENSGTPYVSVTGELSTDLQNKIFKLNTESSQAISGYIKAKEIKLNDVRMTIDNAFATLYLTSLSQEPIYKSTKTLLTVVGDTRNTGMVLSEYDGGKTIVNGGTAPILCEPITGTVVIKTTDDISVYPLKTSGQRIGTQKAVSRTADGYAQFSLDKTDRAMHYEIVRNTSECIKPNEISLGNLQVNNIFSDVNSDNRYKKSIERLALNDFISAKSGNNFSPDVTITKREFIRMLVRALGLDNLIWYDNTFKYFTDVEINEDGAGELAISYLSGITSRDSAKNIYPDKLLTRGDVMEYSAKTLERSERSCQPPDNFNMQQFDDYNTYVGDSKFNFYRLMMGLGYNDSINNNIAPGLTITRAEATDIVYRLMWK